MNRIHLRSTVLGGAAIGLIAGAALYGAVTSGSVTTSPVTPPPFRPARSSVATAPTAEPVPAAKCAAGAKLEDGVCIVRVQRVVVLPAPASAPGDRATRVRDDHTTTAAHEVEERSNEGTEHASNTAEHASNKAEHASNKAEHEVESAEHAENDVD